MIERIETSARMSKIVKHNGVAYLCGQVGDGATVAEQTRDCLSRVDALLEKAGSSREKMTMLPSSNLLPNTSSPK